MKPAFHNKYYNGFTTEVLSTGAPEEIRTPDPQIRSQRTVNRQVRARVATPRPSHYFCLRLF